MMPFKDAVDAAREHVDTPAGRAILEAFWAKAAALSRELESAPLARVREIQGGIKVLREVAARLEQERKPKRDGAYS